jgi:hypothetical protein
MIYDFWWLIKMLKTTGLEATASEEQNLYLGLELIQKT